MTKHPKSEYLPIGEPAFETPDTIASTMGSAESFDADAERPVAVLWLIDPEQRYGWREHYVKKQAPKPAGKLIGFRKKAP